MYKHLSRFSSTMFSLRLGVYLLFVGLCSVFPQEPVDWVEPFTGIGRVQCQLPPASGIAENWSFLKPCEGHLHPGATWPHGMVSAVGFNNGYPTGYQIDNPFSGIAHFQQSGTGGIGQYYNYALIYPVTGEPAFGKQAYAGTAESARVGYYSVTYVEPEVRAEVTVTHHCAFHRYTFQKEGQSHLIANLLHEYESFNEIEAESLSIEGSQGTFRLKIDKNRYLFLALKFDQGTIQWQEGFVHVPVPSGTNRVFHVKLGFSLVSAEKALSNLQNELSNHSFDEVAEKSRQAWKNRFGRIQVEGGSDSQREIFHTALYHSLIKPIDLTGEHPSGDGRPYFLDFATLWDIYQTQIPLLFTFYPEIGQGIVKHLEKSGPFCCSHLLKGGYGFGGQGDLLSHRLIADGYLKGYADIDYTHLLNQMTGQIYAKQDFVNTGIRGNPDKPRAVHTVDRAYASYSTAILAEGLGSQSLKDSLHSLSKNWINVYDPQTGVMTDKSGYYEGGPWNYSFAIWHDVQGLMQMRSNKEEFIADLDAYFGFENHQTKTVKRTYAACNNQNDMIAPYIYLYAGRPDRTQYVVREVMNYRYNTGLGGLAGNDDSGGLSAWYVNAAIGLQPLLGQDVIWIGSPIFDSITLNVAGNLFQIQALDNSDVNRYVQSATLNGAPLERPYLRFTELVEGGEMILQMGPEPSDWGKSNPPPLVAEYREPTTITNKKYHSQSNLSAPGAIAKYPTQLLQPQDLGLPSETNSMDAKGRSRIP